VRGVLLGVLAMGCGDQVRGIAEAAPGVDAAPVAPPTYYRDVAPILTTRCGGCHVEGGVAPFALGSYADASSRAAAIAAATTARVMPPWPADGGGACGTFVDSRWLTGDEIATLATWNAIGAPAGAPAYEPVGSPVPTPFAAAVELVPDAAYLVRPGPDEYRCFVVDPELASDRYITAMAMQLDHPEVVHHVQLYAADDARDEQTIDDRDAQDPQPGYACGNEGVGSGLRYVGVWAPGDLVRRWPDGTGIRLSGGHRMVLQVHYHNHGSGPVLDATGVALELADSVERVGWIESARGQPLYLPPHQPDVTITSEVPVGSGLSGSIRGARLHMHALGTRGRIELVHDGQARCLLDIPRWDFDWQLFYRFVEPIAFVNGDLIRVSCSYDTTSIDEPVTWGIGTEDEMCLGYTFLTE